MKHYYIVTYQSVINTRTISRRIIHISKYNLLHNFDKETGRVLFYSKISKKDAKAWLKELREKGNE